MKDNFYLWVSGAITATIAFNPIVIDAANELFLYLGDVSKIDAYGQPTFGLLLFIWFAFGLIWWIIAQFLVCKNLLLAVVICSWALLLLMVILFPYPVSILLWAVITFVLLN